MVEWESISSSDSELDSEEEEGCFVSEGNICGLKVVARWGRDGVGELEMQLRMGI